MTKEQAAIQILAATIADTNGCSSLGRKTEDACKVLGISFPLAGRFVPYVMEDVFNAMEEKQ